MDGREGKRLSRSGQVRLKRGHMSYSGGSLSIAETNEEDGDEGKII